MHSETDFQQDLEGANKNISKTTEIEIKHAKMLSIVRIIEKGDIARMEQNQELKIEYVPIGKLKPYSKNARKHERASIDVIKKNLLSGGCFNGK